jgi:5'-methylthioadenosine phosphorylase
VPFAGEILVEQADIGIFGGTGIYDSGLLKEAKEITVDTPYGKTSDSIMVGIFKDKKIAFMPRHGRKHTIPPHMINFRANIWAFKQLGITRIIAPSAVGSLKEELAPGAFVLPNQFLDFTKSRKGTFSEDGKVIHISVADPFCPELHGAIKKATSAQNIKMFDNRTYVCIEGPRFSTKAESRFYKSTGADIIGMTLVPECQLAREAQICYASICTVTDYDVWAEKPVTAKEVIETLKKNVESTKKLLTAIPDEIPKSRGCSCAKALEEAEF